MFRFPNSATGRCSVCCREGSGTDVMEERKQEASVQCADVSRKEQAGGESTLNVRSTYKMTTEATLYVS